MKAEIIITRNHEEACALAAEKAAEKFKECPETAATFAAGDTPLTCYARLIEMQGRGEVDLRRAWFIGLDEWRGLGPFDAGSCIETMNRSFYVPAGISRERIFVFDGLAADAEAEAVRMCGVLSGGLGLAVLGVGINGHIGFNEPGFAAEKDFSLVSLSESTINVGRKYFGGKDAPVMGATITLNALVRADRVIIIATGANKRDAVKSIMAGSAVLPAGAFLEHPGACYIFDEESAKMAVAK